MKPQLGIDELNLFVHLTEGKNLENHVKYSVLVL
jgi:hypothetical protein